MDFNPSILAWESRVPSISNRLAEGFKPVNVVNILIEGDVENKAGSLRGGGVD